MRRNIDTYWNSLIAFTLKSSSLNCCHNSIIARLFVINRMSFKVMFAQLAAINNMVENSITDLDVNSEQICSVQAK